MRALLVPALVLALAACPPPDERPDSGDPDAGPNERPWPEATPNAAREIRDTALRFDLAAHTATAIVTFEPGDAGATLSVGDLAFDTVTLDGGALKLSRDGGRLDLGLPASDEPVPVAFAYRWQDHEGFSGASSQGYTLTWPYFCGNLFPCHPQPSDGTTFSLALDGVPAGQLAVFPARIATEAPAYMIAWSIGEYTELDLGTTGAGTRLTAWYHPGELDAVQRGTAHLRLVFDWYERTLGPYPFGAHAGPVSASWGLLNAGMEHHPYWHIGTAGFGSPDTHAHEAAHGWFGDGVRLQCWEDLVLSEGLATYLAARALEAVAPDAGAKAWADDLRELTVTVDPHAPVWPQSCGAVDVLNDRLFTRAVYMRGAFFLRAVAMRVGNQPLEYALSAFFQAHVGHASTMEELLVTIHTVTGFDPRACAERWLRSPEIPTPGPCP